MAALSFSQFPPSSSPLPSSITTSSRRRPFSTSTSAQTIKPTFPIISTTYRRRKQTQFHPSIIIKATKEEDPPLPDPTASESESQATPASEELTELGAEIKKAMKERGGEKDFWGGVAEEIGEIEWPAFGKVLGTTGVVIGVIAGSSVVLTELSDKVFPVVAFRISSADKY